MFCALSFGSRSKSIGPVVASKMRVHPCCMVSGSNMTALRPPTVTGRGFWNRVVLCTASSKVCALVEYNSSPYQLSLPQLQMSHPGNLTPPAATSFVAGLSPAADISASGIEHGFHAVFEAGVDETDAALDDATGVALAVPCDPPDEQPAAAANAPTASIPPTTRRACRALVSSVAFRRMPLPSRLIGVPPDGPPPSDHTDDRGIFQGNDPQSETPRLESRRVGHHGLYRPAVGVVTGLSSRTPYVMPQSTARLPILPLTMEDIELIALRGGRQDPPTGRPILARHGMLRTTARLPISRACGSCGQADSQGGAALPRDPYNLYDDDEYFYDDDVEIAAPQSWLEDSFGRAPKESPPPVPKEPPPPVAEEPPTRIGVSMPPVVVIPARPKSDGGVEIELSSRVTGDPVALVFSNVERLVERLGRYQPWMMAPSAAVPALLGTAAITIVLDPSETICAAQWTSQRLQTLEEYQS